MDKSAGIVLKGVTEYLVRDCNRSLERGREREVRAVLGAAVGLAVMLGAPKDAVDDLFTFVCANPMFADVLTPLEVLLSDEQRVRLSGLKMLSLETRSCIVAASRPEDPSLLN